MLPISDRFRDAVQFALELHDDHARKGDRGVPYIAHLFGVASLVMEHGGDEDATIAALLHDAVEDRGGQPTLDRIRERFGPRVAEIVVGCTDAITAPKPKWRPRKEAFIAQLADADEATRLVTGCDKIHNARAILRDVHARGDEVFAIFAGGKDGTMWYYRTIADLLLKLGPPAVAAELDRIVTDIERLIAVPD
ncbi:MAG: HD domain-containing protein [Phycisphaera sp.]|nr:HD domain-containing protein [Phycisphaera sp.]